MLLKGCCIELATVCLDFSLNNMKHIQGKQGGVLMAENCQFDAHFLILWESYSDSNISFFSG